MENDKLFNFNKVLYFKDKDKAVIGKKYYFFNVISVADMENITYYEPQELKRVSLVNHSCFYNSTDESYPFIYPAEEM